MAEELKNEAGQPLEPSPVKNQELNDSELEELSGGTIPKLKADCGTQDSGTLGCGG